VDILKTQPFGGISPKYFVLLVGLNQYYLDFTFRTKAQPEKQFVHPKNQSGICGLFAAKEKV
jgi:hypothetical protein